MREYPKQRSLLPTGINYNHYLYGSYQYRGGILIRWDTIIMIFIRFFLSITGLQPSVVIDNGFLECITILLKHKVPKDFSIRAQFVFSESVQGHTDADYGKHKLK